jgi:hypothetical protein
VQGSIDGKRNWTSPACDIRSVGAVLYATITGRPPLFLETYWAGFLTKTGDLDPRHEEEFKQMLATCRPLPLTEFFAATREWNAPDMQQISDLVAAWLEPNAAARTPPEWQGPAQQAALEALQRATGGLRSAHPQLMSREIGVHRLTPPNQGRFGGIRVGVPRTGTRGPNFTTVDERIALGGPAESDTDTGVQS